MRPGDTLPVEQASCIRAVALFEQVSIPMATFDLAGNYLESNEAFRALFGYSQEELNTLDLLELIHPDDRETSRRGSQLFFLNGCAEQSANLLCRTKAGGTLQLKITASRVRPKGAGPDFALAIFENRWEAVIERAQWERSEALFRSLFEATPEPMMIVDPEGIVELANPAATKALSRGGRSVAGTVCPCAYEPGKVESFVLSSPAGACEFEVRAVPLDASETPPHLVCLRDVTHLVRAAEQLRDLCLMDDLTGLYNRRGFLSLARQHLLVANRTQRGVALVFIDLDDLKVLNDNYGHLEGDRALVKLAEVLRKVFRRSDVVARIGGDEFAVLALETGDQSTEMIRQRLEQALEESNRNSNKPWSLSVSCGLIAYDPSFPTDIQTLLQMADAAMYRDKNARHSKAASEGACLVADRNPSEES